MQSERPSWLHEACPTWCLREHVEDDHLEDREHHGEPVSITVTASGEDLIPATEALGSMELVVQLHRGVGTSLEWVSIEPAEARQPRLALTRESSRQLSRALRRVDADLPPAVERDRGDDLSPA